MDKKPLIVVSICAVVLLLLGSLSNVVGYQSVKSTVNDSPLFQTRTQRATNQQQNIITSQYLGKGKGIFLQFPTKDNKTVSLKKIIGIITNMSSKEFNHFIRKSNLDMNKEDFIGLLYTLNKVNGSYIINNQDFPLLFTVGEPVYPHCMLWFLMVILQAIGICINLIVLMIFDKIFPTSLPTCSPGSFCAGTKCLNR